MILNCYLFIFRVQSKQKKGICANIFMTKCVYEPFIELLKVFFNLFKYKTRTAIKKGSSHHCGLPLIRELFKKSSYYQYLFLCKYRIKFILFYHHMAARRRSFRGKYRINFILSFHLILFIILFFRCCECITHQRTDGHWTNTTRNGRNKRAFGSDFFELHIAIKAKSVLLC